MKLNEIIEPQPTEEEIKEYTNKFLEVWEPISKQFGNLFDELIRIKNDSGLNLEDNIKEEPQEHKIPEKIEICYSPDIEEEIFYEKGNKPNHYVLGDAGTKLIINKINEILDYLEVNNDGKRFRDSRIKNEN